MKSQVLHTGMVLFFGQAAGEIWNWPHLGVKGLNLKCIRKPCCQVRTIITLASLSPAFPFLSWLLSVHCINMHSAGPPYRTCIPMPQFPSTWDQRNPGRPQAPLGEVYFPVRVEGTHYPDTTWSLRHTLTGHCCMCHSKCRGRHSNLWSQVVELCPAEFTERQKLHEFSQ